MIAIVNYGMGNLGSVKNAFDFIGADSRITGKSSDLEKADKIVLPGVGAFGDAMDNLREKGLDEAVIRQIEKGKPFLGICLGLQMLFESSEENPGIKGLGILKGTVKKFSADIGLKIPQIGWNSIKTNEDMSFLGRFDGRYMYFVHSYYVEPTGMSGHCAKTTYGLDFTSAVEYENILACQFHPEKSGKAGLEILKKWAEVEI